MLFIQKNPLKVRRNYSFLKMIHFSVIRKMKLFNHSLIPFHSLYPYHCTHPVSSLKKKNQILKRLLMVMFFKSVDIRSKYKSY